MNYKALRKTLKTEQQEALLKYGAEIRWYERVSKTVPIAKSYFVCILSHYKLIPEYLSTRFLNGRIPKI
jgi:hypothetical protein